MSISGVVKDILNEIDEDITFIAVSKTRPSYMIEEAYKAGVSHFGENKVQEMIGKMDELEGRDINWHLLGHLQKNKVKYLADKDCLIHSIDSVDLVKVIEKRFGEKDTTCRGLIQVNIGREENKTGILVENLENLLQNIETSNNIKIYGLMAIIPKGDEDSNRRYFRQMNELFTKLKEKEFNNICMKYLSMGMSEDYKAAIDEGSNMIRVGKKIFGERVGGF